MRFPVALMLLLSSTSFASAKPSTCWGSSLGVNASWGHLTDLQFDAIDLCSKVTTPPLALVPAGSIVFGFQSALWVGNFSSLVSCENTFNQILNDCYGSANPNIPVTLGGNNTDVGGAVLAISFGTAGQL